MKITFILLYPSLYSFCLHYSLFNMIFPFLRCIFVPSTFRSLRLIPTFRQAFPTVLFTSLCQFLSVSPVPASYSYPPSLFISMSYPRAYLLSPPRPLHNPHFTSPLPVPSANKYFPTSIRTLPSIIHRLKPEAPL